MPNRFEQVDEPVPDAISVILQQRSDGKWARVYCPKSAAPSMMSDRASDSSAPTDALSAAVKLANELKLAVVVVDPDNVWKKEWGELFRDDGEEQPE
jgi:hypothetical protein